ncbi:hypothetical protein GCM10009679_62910 [Saccharothrix algeriensis]
MPTPLSHAERGRLGAAKTHAGRSPEERKEHARRAYLVGAVRTVVDRAPELTDDQMARLRALFAPALQAGERS